MSQAISLQYDSRLIEEAVFLARKDKRETKQIQRERDRIYQVADPDERERLFAELNRSWFVRLELGNVIQQALQEQPVIQSNVKICFALCAAQAKDEGAELFVAPDESPAPFKPFKFSSVPLCEKIKGDFSPSLPLWKRGIKGDFSAGGHSVTERRTVRILIRPESLLRPESLRTFLRHELFHIADMLDPAFAYEPALPKTDGGPTYDTLIRNRYRVLWDMTINGRMMRRGWISESVRDEQLSDFRYAFSMLREKRGDLFSRFFDGERPTHTELAAFAFDPRAAGCLNGTSAPGTHCPLCRFPTHAFETEPENLGEEVIAAINQDFPLWAPALGLCAQCADLYRAHQLSTVAAKELPGWH